MKNEVNPYRKLEADISPKEFEEFCMHTLSAYAEREGLHAFSILHDQKIQAHDGTYQIDILCEFDALGCRFKVLVECKMTSRPVEREVLSGLHDKMLSIGAHKAIVMSTCGFQSGATEYADAHGIALIQVFDNYIMHAKMSAAAESLVRAEFEAQVMTHLPKYEAYLWSNEYDLPFEMVFPTRDMISKAIEQVRESKNE